LHGNGVPQAALTGNGGGLTGGTSPTLAVTVTSLGDAGRVAQTTDPRGLVTTTDTRRHAQQHDPRPDTPRSEP
jgi:hypothetical protein